MARHTPQVGEGVLLLHEQEGTRRIAVGDAEWWQWLERDGTTFSFSGSRGRFTARHERKSGGWYWYAYRKYQGKLYKAYLGKSEELTLERLNDVATHLADQARFAPGPDAVPAVSPGQASAVLPEKLSPVQPLLTTKLSPPPTRTDLIVRSRLRMRLDTGSSKKLTLISAPAGFGKTTLLGAWCNERGTTLPHAWLSLDSGDNDLAHFWTYVVAALQKLVPGIDSQVQPLLQTLNSHTVERLLTPLLNMLAKVPHEMLLVLDDYHLITAPDVHDALAFLLEHLPPRFHLVIASRSDPPLPLTRLRAQGQLNELRTEELRFTHEEVAAFLRQVMGLSLSDGQITSLDEHTEGWIAGLQLAALSMQGRKDIAGFLASFTGSHRYIFDYMTNEVLQRQAEGVRTFLLQTSILERLSASLCDAVTQRNDSRQVLEMLERSNLFLLPLDEQRQWYRYHHLFAEFLRERLRQEMAELLPGLHRRASQWYERYGLMAVTMEHALASGDMDYTVHLAERFALPMMTRGEVTMLLGWLSKLPRKLIDAQPHLLVMQAGAYVAIGQLAEAAHYLAEVEHMLTRLKANTNYDRDEYKRLEDEFLTARTILAAYSVQGDEAIAFAQQALAHLAPEDAYQRSIVCASMGYFYFFHGDLERASEYFRQAITLGIAAQNLHAALACMAAQGYIQLLYGHLHRAGEVFKEAIKVGTRQGGRLFSVVSMTYTSLSELLYEWNRLDEAERYAQEGLELGQHWGYVAMLAQGYLVRVRLLLARGEPAEALDLLQHAEQLVQHYSPFPTMALLGAWRAYSELQLGQREAALRWAEEVRQRTDHQYTLVHDHELLLLAQIDMACEQFASAQPILAALQRRAEAGDQQRLLIESLTLQAVLAARQGGQNQAIAVLARALALAEPEGYVRIFLDKGPAIVPLLRQAAAHGITPPYTHALLKAAGIASGSAHAEGLLSERELHILGLLARGKSNQEIARELVIAVSTVKTHTDNIYTKLGVHSRTQAIAQARKRGLLED